MNSLFKEDILTVGIEVQGETDTYTVTISFGGFLTEVQRYLQRGDPLSLKVIIRALINAFNGDNVYVRCDCPDFYYRFGYFLSKNDIIYGERQPIPSDITNPDNDLGCGCKHVMLVLANHMWLLKVASTVWNYVNYMEKNRPKLYQTIIYPAIYDKEYEAVQLDIFDDEDELQTDTKTIDTANVERGTSGRFRPGNKYRFQNTRRDKDQLSIEDEETEESK